MEQKKKAGEWFKELPPTICQLATESIVSECKEKNYGSLEGALVSTFVWSSTAIGWEFWHKVDNSLHKKQVLDALEIEAAKFVELNSLDGHNVALAKQLLAEMEGEDE